MAENVSDNSVPGQLKKEIADSSEDKSSCLRFINEIAATVILTLSVISVVAAIVIFSLGSKREVVRHEYTFTIKVDSTTNLTPAAQMQVDSIISSIKQHEHIINDRYDYVLEQRENALNYLTVGGIFVTVILSIFGFFGYKSFRNIEEDAKLSAKKIAENKTEEIAEEQATSVALRLNKKLNNKLEVDQQNALTSFKNRVIPDAVVKAVEQKFGQVVEDKILKVDVALEKLQTIEQDITELKRAKDEEIQSRKPARKKRMRLEDAPGIQSAEINNLGNNTENETPKSEG